MFLAHPEIWRHISYRGIVTVIMGAIYFLKKLYGKKLRKSARAWPCTQATIEYAAPRKLERDEGKGWVGELSYSYSIGGEYYSGFHHFPAKGKRQAECLVVGWKGRQVRIHYDPNDVCVSFLFVEEQEHGMGNSFATPGRLFIWLGHTLDPPLV
jgi:Protein of unknown function (DUF3592)